MKFKFLIILYYLASNSLGLYFVKNFFKTTKDASLFSMAALTNPQLMVGAVLYASSFLAWLWLLSKEDLSTIYPIIVGLGYIAILAMSFVVLKEQPTLSKFIGAFLIISGVLFLVRNVK